jgi:hypothetical protein
MIDDFPTADSRPMRLMIRDKAMAVAGGERSLPPMRQTNPIWPGEAGKSEIRSSKPETNRKPQCSKGGAGDVSAAPNKANHSICWGSELRGYYIWERGTIAPNRPIRGLGDCRAALAMTRMGAGAAEPRPNAKCQVALAKSHGDTIHEIRVRRVDKMRNKANLPLWATCRAPSDEGSAAIRDWASGVRDTRFEIRDTRSSRCEIRTPCGQNVKQSQFRGF